MATRADVIAEARTWIDTPFRHQGRTKGEGADCIGLIAGVGNKLGLSNFQYTGYGRLPMPLRSHIQNLLLQHVDRVPRGEEKGGDFCWMKNLSLIGEPRHFALLTFDGTIIHSELSLGKCVEQRFIDKYRNTVIAWYRFRGLSD